MTSGRITADPDIMAGVPTVRGTRVSVSAILGQLASGSTVDELLADYPSLTRDDVYASLAFAAESMPQERPFAPTPVGYAMSPVRSGPAGP